MLHAKRGTRNVGFGEKLLRTNTIVEGQPDGEAIPVYVRHGYIMKYNEKYRIPDWVEYHIVPEYLKTPKREKQYAKFREDPDMKSKNPVKDKDYVDTKFSRGHMAPYFAMGGDRNKNGVYANLFSTTSDPYDDMTIFQANYLSNIAPQDQDALNGAGGPWYALETKIRNVLLGKNKMELNIIVGASFSDSVNYETMTGKSATGHCVPDKFYQVLICKDTAGHYVTGAFLFPHVRERKDLPYTDLIQYIVPVDSIEQLTGLNFLNKLSPELQSKIESSDHRDFWFKNGIQ